VSSGAFELPRGAYPERFEPQLGWLDRQGQRLADAVARGWRRRSLHPTRWIAAVERHGQELVDLDSAELAARVPPLRAELARTGLADDAVARAFALVRETATRTLGERHYDVQLVGGLILVRGMVAEMETGEGKTLTATLAASTAALAGTPTHVVTVNDYLAQRDAEWMGPIYRGLGLSVGVIQHGMSPEERHAAYDCDVTYCTNKELVFDYLRDRIALGPDATRVRLAVERLRGARGRRALLSPTAPTRSWSSTTCAIALPSGPTPRAFGSRSNACAGRGGAGRCCAGSASPSSTRPTAYSSTRRARL
jgi:preprotein translocase subunit SecA